eukprot:5153703-Heterocapsa_arctica.AAC.1
MQQAYARGFQIYFWAALPCTPWSSWQHVNAAFSTDVRARLEGQRRESLQMVGQIVNASRRLREAGVKFELAFEWPRGAD